MAQFTTAGIKRVPLEASEVAMKYEIMRENWAASRHFHRSMLIVLFRSITGKVASFKKALRVEAVHLAIS